MVVLEEAAQAAGPVLEKIYLLEVIVLSLHKFLPHDDHLSGL